MLWKEQVIATSFASVKMSSWLHVGATLVRMWGQSEWGLLFGSGSMCLELELLSGRHQELSFDVEMFVKHFILTKLSYTNCTSWIQSSYFVNLSKTKTLQSLLFIFCTFLEDPKSCLFCMCNTTALCGMSCQNQSLLNVDQLNLQLSFFYCYKPSLCFEHNLNKTSEAQLKASSETNHHGHLNMLCLMQSQVNSCFSSKCRILTFHFYAITIIVTIL